VNRTAPGPTPPAPGAQALFSATHLWIWGTSVGYKSKEFPGADAVTLAGGASGHAPVNDMITALGPLGHFTVQDALINGNMNTVNVEYDYLALNADASFLAMRVFASVRQTGVAPPSIWSAIGFTPGLVFGRQGGASFSAAACFRGPHHLGVDSTRCSNIGSGNNLATDGITAIDFDAVDFGIVPAPVGDPFYAWAFPAGPAITVTVQPTYTLGSAPQPNACNVPFIGGPGSAPCAAATPVFP
jgi:hypothetical protein